MSILYETLSKEASLIYKLFVDTCLTGEFWGKLDTLNKKFKPINKYTHIAPKSPITTWRARNCLCVIFEI